MNGLPSPDTGDDSPSRKIINPYERVFCKNRTLVPTICDGTCYSCRKEREIFFHDESERVFFLENAHPGVGSSMEHDNEPTSIEEAQLKVLRKIAKLDLAKEKHFPNLQKKD